MTTINLPITPETFYGFLALLGLVLASGLIVLALPKTTGEGQTPLEKLQDKLNLSALPPIAFLIAVAIWCALLGLLIAGLFITVSSAIFANLPESRDAVWNFRFLMAQLAALAAVIGAAVALPFTLIRLRLTREQNDLTDEALFNDKINAAATDLAARRQVTRVVKDKDGKETVLTEWKDDLVTRAAAIDRLEGLARERAHETPRIARMLSVYLRELSREYPPQKPPAGATPDKLGEWANALTPARSDMEKAAQTLGRLKTVVGINPDSIPIDLRGANLQGFDLSGLTFDKALLQGAELQGARLSGAKLRGAGLSEAKLQGAGLFGAELQGARLREAKLQGHTSSGPCCRGQTSAGPS